ncbi:hypothetical protein [Roseateles paludis]|jgi:hypothetical protein|uniref:Sugar transporter n=1 Tax=Roseateles paludis TaxID=3145238 RepID=A0ABV0FX85_9BURK
MQKPPTWFVVVAVLALLWNAFGLMAVLMDALATPEQLAALPADQQTLRQARPLWSVAASFVAVVGGTLGCLALLLRKRWAVPVLVASFVGVVLQDIGLVMQAGTSAIPQAAFILQGLVLVIAVALVDLARRAVAKGWLG